MRHEEEDLQMACVMWFDLAFPKAKRLLHASPNGGFRRIKEAAKLKRMGTRAGFPDLILLVPNKAYSFLALELKTPTGRLSQVQKDYSEDILSAGGDYQIIRSLDEFIKAIEEHLKNLNKIIS